MKTDLTCILETIKLSISEKHQIPASGCPYMQKNM